MTDKRWAIRRNSETNVRVKGGEVRLYGLYLYHFPDIFRWDMKG